MHSSLVRRPKSRVDAALAARKLSAWSIAARVIAAATPLTVVAGVVPAGIAATGGNTFPIVFLAIAVILGLFSVGYLAAARRFPPVDASGAFYCLISHGLGRPAGVGAGWVAAITYAALPIGLYGMIGTAITPLLTDMFAVTVAWQLVAVITALLVGALGLANIATSSRVLMVLVSAEITVNHRRGNGQLPARRPRPGHHHRP